MCVGIFFCGGSGSGLWYFRGVGGNGFGCCRIFEGYGGSGLFGFEILLQGILGGKFLGEGGVEFVLIFFGFFLG